MEQSKIRLKEHLGIVTSDTSTVKFSFFVSPMKNRIRIGKGDYVMIDHPVFGEICPLLAVVKGIKSYEEVVGTTLSEKSVNMIAEGEIIGYVDLREEVRSLQKLFVPPDPGSMVYLPYVEFLEDIFTRGRDGRSFEHALHLGSLESRATDRMGDVKTLGFYLDALDFKRHHFLITGITGVGKTHTATVIVEELANKTRCPIVILDPYGEYTTVGVAGSPLKELVEKGHVSNIDYPFDFTVTICALDAEKVTALLERHGITLGEAKLFVKHISSQLTLPPDEKAEQETREELREFVRPHQVTVLDSRGLAAEDRRSFYTCCVRALWSDRVDGIIEPFVLVVEEAESLEAETLRTIASEGRKLGVSMCLLSQNPAKINGRVLSQMGMQFMGRTTDVNDLKYLGNMATEKSFLLPQLRTGEWIVNGITLRQPTRVFVRGRYSFAI